MASATVVVNQSGSDSTAVGNLFDGLRFFVVQRLPARTDFLAKITSNGGTVVKLEAQADYIVADHAKAGAPGGSISYTFITTALRNGKLPDPNEHLASYAPRGSRISGSRPGAPSRIVRIPFTPEDDRMLLEWVQKCIAKGQTGVQGNEIYKQLEKVNPRHTFHSWRDRYLKRLMRPSHFEVQVAANPPPSPPAAPDNDGNIPRAQPNAVRARHNAAEAMLLKQRADRIREDQRRSLQIDEARAAAVENADDVEEMGEGNETDAEERGDGNESDVADNSNGLLKLWKADGENDFTVGQFNNLMKNAADIEASDTERRDEAWELFSEAFPVHTGRNWRKFYEDVVRPVYQSHIRPQNDARDISVRAQEEHSAEHEIADRSNDEADATKTAPENSPLPNEGGRKRRYATEDVSPRASKRITGRQHEEDSADDEVDSVEVTMAPRRNRKSLTPHPDSRSSSDSIKDVESHGSNTMRVSPARGKSARESKAESNSSESQPFETAPNDLLDMPRRDMHPLNEMFAGDELSPLHHPLKRTPVTEDDDDDEETASQVDFKAQMREMAASTKHAVSSWGADLSKVAAALVSPLRGKPNAESQDESTQTLGSSASLARELETVKSRGVFNLQSGQFSERGAAKTDSIPFETQAPLIGFQTQTEAEFDQSGTLEDDEEEEEEEEEEEDDRETFDDVDKQHRIEEQTASPRRKQQVKGPQNSSAVHSSVIVPESSPTRGTKLHTHAMDTQDILDFETQGIDFAMPPPNLEDSDEIDFPSSAAIVTQDTQESDDGGTLAFIDRMRDRGFEEVAITNALMCTTMNLELAELVLLYEDAGDGVPTDMAGIWSAQEDADLESTDPEAIRRLEEKHSWELCQARMEFLAGARALE